MQTDSGKNWYKNVNDFIHLFYLAAYRIKHGRKQKNSRSPKKPAVISAIYRADVRKKLTSALR